jgi:hypothetical protein
MKKILKMLSLTVCICATQYSVGQDTQTTVTTTTSTSTSTDDSKSDNGDAASAYFGVRYMPTFTFLKFNQVDNSTVETTAVWGHGFGALLGFNLSDHVGLQGEVIYSSLSQKYRVGERENEVKLNYVNIPLLLVLNTDYSAPVNLNFVIGPQLGINVGSSVNSSANGSGTDTLNARIAVKSGDVGFAYGAGLDFGMGTSGRTRLSLGFRGVYGLVDVSDNSNNLETSDYYVLDKSHVKTYAGYIGLTFGF